jgi:nitrate reductase NapA
LDGLAVTMSKVDRRTFLRSAATASAATAAASIVPDRPLTAGSGASLRTGQEPVWKKAPCRLCGVGCGLLVGVAEGRAVAVKGDPDSPVSRGSACAKGYYSVQALYGRDRIAHALVRRGDALVKVPLGEAHDLIARKLRETIDRYGKDAVGVYGSAQWTILDAYVASKLFKAGLGTDNVETSTRLYAASAMAGLQSSFGLDGAIGAYEDIEHADVFVLWNVNLAETDPVLFARMLDRRRRDPAVRIVHLSTRTTRTSYAADRTLLHVPHAELAIANAVCQELVARKLVDREFVKRYVAFKRGKTEFASGADAGMPPADDGTDVTWDAYVAFLADSTPEHAQAWSGIAAESIRWLASLYGDRARKVMSVWGADVNRDVRGTWTNNALYNIHLLVGKIASPGNAPFCTTGQPSGGCAVHDAGTLAGTLPSGNVANEADRRRASEIWSVPVERIGRRPGHDALSLFRALERGDIRFLWIQATDPMLSLPNLGRYRVASEKGTRFIVVSEAYPTPTTDVADVVLPAAMWIEREGLFANAERRAQHFERLVAPVGDAASDARHMIEVANRLDLSALFPWPSQSWVDAAWEEYGRFHADPRSALPPLSALRAQPGLRWPYVNGRETPWRYNAAYDPAADRRRGDFDFYGHPDHRAWIWLRPYQPPAEAPDHDYPFWLTTGAVLEHWGMGSMTQRIPTLHRAVPHAYAELNRDDATQLGIRDGDTVRLVSRRGAVDVVARVDYRSQPPRGLLFVPTFDETVPVNRLTLDAACPLSGQPDGGKCAVRLERVGPRGAA